MSPSPFAAASLSAAIAEKSEGNESGVSESNDEDPPEAVVVVSLLLPESFDELPHADKANANAATVAIAARRVLERDEELVGDGWFFTSVSCRKSRGVTAVPGSRHL